MRLKREHPLLTEEDPSMVEQRLQHTSGGVGVWEHFTVQDGLPDMKIESLFVDSRGDLWIGTHSRGVARFDGDRFKVFTRREGLAGDGVFSILEDREGALWLGRTGG
jgi:ligand-binding sensor domain-containing protein